MKFIGLDIGTTSITGLVYDLECRAVLHAVTEQNSSGLQGTGMEWEILQDPAIIIDIVEKILQKLLTFQPEIAGIGLTGQMHGILYIGQDGQHVSPLYTWQDGRAGLHIRNSVSYAEELSERSGYRIAPGYGLATHYYNLQCGLVPGSTVHLCTIADYAAMKLTGSHVPQIDATQAAAIGGYSFSIGRFDPDALSKAGIDAAILPQVVPSGTMVGGSEQGIPVYASLGDNQASFLGSVPLPDESVLLNIGTGSQLSLLMADDTCRAEGMEARPYPGGGVLMVGAALSGGRSYALLENFFRQLIGAYNGKEPAEAYSLIAELMTAESECGGNSGLAVNTQFLGTRSDPLARGSIEGISLDNFTPGKMAHAFLRGMIGELHGFYTEVTGSGIPAYKTLVGSGNALRANPVLCAKAQDTFGLPLMLSASQEEAAVGAALCAAVGAGRIGSFREAGQYIITKGRSDQ
ncbi:hypothetical protein C2I18_25935 [Paenibacillus sp. PK3_47]|uniref:sedoheptulokinase n=1 Tax=Paenibacillus sp. PK3_47 TaxID=2072642 RepID=UPI00201E00CF|nr:FGGY family carbohydrate kinase [Paenibacillus sp. PK3_47]UQZ36672.1 hypothetical protein C2I18_25935 [Paenibacillus sp. PK3_47]